MNPETNRFEKLEEPNELQKQLLDRMTCSCPPGALLRPNGEPVPAHWSVFTVGEEIVIKGHTFKVAYIGECNILFEPVGVPMIGDRE